MLFSYLAPSPPFGSAALAFSLHLSPMYYFGQRTEGGSNDKAAFEYLLSLTGASKGSLVACLQRPDQVYYVATVLSLDPCLCIVSLYSISASYSLLAIVALRALACTHLLWVTERYSRTDWPCRLSAPRANIRRLASLHGEHTASWRTWTSTQATPGTVHSQQLWHHYRRNS